MIQSLFIKNLRQKLNFSQGYIAGELGISRPTYVQIENGKGELTLSQAQKLAKIFSMSLEEFLKENEPKEIKIEIEKLKKKQISSKSEMRISVPQKKLNKFKEVLLYILGKVGAKSNIGETVIYKLLYYIDFDYYEKFEEQLIGATYIKNHHGPTPIEFQVIVNEMEKRGEIEKIKSKYFQYDQKKYLPRRDADLSEFTAQEIKHIDEVLERLSDKNANELSNYSHNDVPWITAEDNKAIDYEAVFYRTPATSVRDYGD